MLLVIDLADLSCATLDTSIEQELGDVFVAGLVVYHNGKVSGAAPLHAFGDAVSVREDQARALRNLSLRILLHCPAVFSKVCR